MRADQAGANVEIAAAKGSLPVGMAAEPLAKQTSELPKKATLLCGAHAWQPGCPLAAVEVETAA